jgi:hypothetical protein
MMSRNLTLFIFLYLIYAIKIPAQDLDSMLQVELNNQNEIKYTEATFKASRIILGQSAENKAYGDFDFLISHHFGDINSGAYNYFGLDYSEIRLGFEYGITNRFSVGFGRSSYNKIFDGNFKVKLLRQSSGTKNFPVTVSFYSSLALNSLHWSNPERDNRFDSRLSYAFEFLLARKVNSQLSLQIIPSMIHRNIVKTKEDQNDVFAIGAGGRYKFAKRASVNAEYYYLLPGRTADIFYDSFSIGIDIETGGHVFQLFLTNSNGLTEESFIAKTQGNWLNGDIKLGFNISRTFSLIKKKISESEN